MNPTSKVFTAAELAFIADLLVKHDAYAVCDEVYEHLTYDGWRHIPLMTLPGLRERCLRIGSAGKTFSLTGWKIGYITAPPRWPAGGAGAPEPHVHHAAQPATRNRGGLAKDDAYFAGLASALEAKRDRLSSGLAAIGFGMLPSQGSYFVSADFSPLGFAGDDVAFCRHITEHAGVTAIPVSAFYDAAGGPAPGHYARFAFCKADRGARRGGGPAERGISPAGPPAAPPRMAGARG